MILDYLGGPSPWGHWGARVSTGQDFLIKVHFPILSTRPLQLESHAGRAQGLQLFLYHPHTQAGLCLIRGQFPFQEMGKWQPGAPPGGSSERGSPHHGLTAPCHTLAHMFSTQRLTSNLPGALLAHRSQTASRKGETCIPSSVPGTGPRCSECLTEAPGATNGDHNVHLSRSLRFSVWLFQPSPTIAKCSRKKYYLSF